MSREKIIVHEVFPEKNKSDFNSEVQTILSDFQILDFEKNPCDDPSDVINYNEGKEANPFDKIAKYYGRHKNVFLFISMLRDREQSENIIDVVSQKCNDQAKEKFIKRMNLYLDRINNGENEAKEFLNSNEFIGAFFHGPYTGEDRNIHANLNINITTAEQVLETDIFFSRMIKSIDDEKSEVKRAKIYCNGKRILTIEKIGKQQRNYNFTKFAICDIEISWNAKNGFGNELDCSIVLNINLGQIRVKKSTVDSVIVELSEILELAKQNTTVLIKNKALHEKITDSQ